MPGADLVVMVWIVIDYNPSQGDVVSSNYDAVDEDPTVAEEEDADDVADGIIGAALYLSIYLLKNRRHNSSACQQRGTNYQEDKNNNNT